MIHLKKNMKQLKKTKILITGSAGFIGYHLVKKLVKQNFSIIGLDSINDYYDVKLKYDRLNNTGIPKSKILENKPLLSEKYSNYKFYKTNLEDYENLKVIFQKEKFDYVINLAAQAGVRYSLENPQAYIKSNISGFFNIIDLSKSFKIKHLFYASSSSVYGLGKDIPFSVEKSNTDTPASLYAATKKANELISHSYSHMFNLKSTGLRFFTVYGPWGRPDMALFLFVKGIYENKPINIYNNGIMMRDFTFIDDIIESINKLLDYNINNEKKDSNYEILNLGNSSPVNLLDFINEIESQIGKKALKKYLPLQDGDVEKTYADVEELYKKINFKPKTNFKYGIKSFLSWYKLYYNIK